MRIIKSIIIFLKNLLMTLLHINYKLHNKDYLKPPHKGIRFRRTMRKIKTDSIGCMIDDVHEMENSELLEELGKIPGLELLLAASVMAFEPMDISDLIDLIAFAKGIESTTDFVCALADGNSEEPEYLLAEVKDNLRAKYPNITDYLEEIYGSEFESTLGKRFPNEISD